jgi:hypothetical protein
MTDPMRWLEHRARIAECRLLAEDARHKARYDPEEEENAEYFEAEAARLEQQLLDWGHAPPRRNPEDPDEYAEVSFDKAPMSEALLAKRAQRAAEREERLGRLASRREERRGRLASRREERAAKERKAAEKIKALEESLGTYRIVDNEGLLDDFLAAVLARQIEWSFEDVSGSNFGFLCYGDFLVSVPARNEVRGTYSPSTDTIKVSAPSPLLEKSVVYGDSFVLLPKDKINENLAARFTNPRFRWTIVHELGHRLHHQRQDIVDMRAARIIFRNAPKGAFVSSYAKTHVHEMIAEAFACYIMPNYYLIKRGLPEERVYRALKVFQEYIKIPLDSADERLSQMIRVNPEEP